MLFNKTISLLLQVDSIMFYRQNYRQNDVTFSLKTSPIVTIDIALIWTSDLKVISSSYWLRHMFHDEVFQFLKSFYIILTFGLPFLQVSFNADPLHWNILMNLLKVNNVFQYHAEPKLGFFLNTATLTSLFHTVLLFW